MYWYYYNIEQFTYKNAVLNDPASIIEFSNLRGGNIQENVSMGVAMGYMTADFSMGSSYTYNPKGVDIRTIDHADSIEWEVKPRNHMSTERCFTPYKIKTFVLVKTKKRNSNYASVRCRFPRVRVFEARFLKADGGSVRNTYYDFGIDNRLPMYVSLKFKNHSKY